MPRPETMQLAGHIASAGTRALPADVAERGKMHLLDTIAATVAGSALRAGELGRIWSGRWYGNRGAATVFGAGGTSDPFSAAVANGMSAHADEFDDSHAGTLTHPGCAIMPAAYAMTEAMGADGATLLRAFVCGYDVLGRIGRAARSAGQGMDRGRWSSHSVITTWGAAAAAAAALSLPVNQCRHVLSYAAQLASGVTSWVRDIQHVQKAYVFAGMPAGSGILAATTVSSGWTGVDDPFFGSPNWFEALGVNHDSGLLAHNLGIEFDVMSATIKKYAVGSPMQAALETVVELLAKGLDHRAIACVYVHLAPEGAVVVNGRAMPNVNIQYILSATLLDGGFSAEVAHDADRMSQPDVRDMMRRIHLIPDGTYAGTRGATVRVEFTDGRTIESSTNYVRGTSFNPMSFGEVASKARQLMDGILGETHAQRVVDLVADIERQPSLDTLSRIVRAAPPVASRPPIVAN